MQNMETLYISNTDDIFKDAQKIIEQTRNHAYQAINIAMVQRNWLLGKRIAEEEMQGENRAEYGKKVIKRLATQLTNLYGKGFTKSNLYQFVTFYNFFPKFSTHRVENHRSCHGLKFRISSTSNLP